MARAHKDRLRFELQDVRRDMLDAIRSILPEELDYKPAPDMKSYREHLQEVGAMEAVTLGIIVDGAVPEWEPINDQISGPSISNYIEALAHIREQTLAHLDQIEEADLQEAVPMPGEWKEFFGAPDVEREELFRWIIRHEYYHVGQLVIYRWVQGHNPYKNEP